METRIMLDLETMGTGPNAAIIAIGAVKFDLNGITDTFYDMISLESSIEVGLTVDAGAIVWWMQQSDHARSVFDSKILIGLRRALDDFATWIGHPDTEIWGNGSDFDNVILSNAYKACGMNQPWNFRYNRCYRTIKNIHTEFKAEKTGTAHCAIDDAKNQAEHLIDILGYIEGWRTFK